MDETSANVLDLAWDEARFVDPDTADDWVYEFTDALRGMYPAEAGRLRDAARYDFASYRDRPAEYIREVLKKEPTPKQVEIAQLLKQPPYKVIAVSANNVGKTHVAGSLINWFYDCYDPSICISTAPTERHVKEVLWKEVRSQRTTTWDFRGDRVPELYDHQDHYAKGYTGRDAEAFHGRHPEHLFIILDEATALEQFVWQGVKSMFKRTGKHHLLALLNPTDTTSAAYAECESRDLKGMPNYHVVRLSALDHPNIIAQLKGAKEPHIPGAVDLDQLDEWFGDYEKFEPIHPDDFQLGDVLWPPTWADIHGALERYGGVRLCLRATPEGQSRVLGLWPTSTPGAVWSDIAWKSATRELDGLEPLPILWRRPPQIGCDVATGTSDRSDKTEIIAQIEGCALEHVVGSGWDHMRSALQLKELAIKYAHLFNERRPQDVPYLAPEGVAINVDDGGPGGGVVSILKTMGYRAVPVNVTTSARKPEKYPIMRDELWFTVPLAARTSLIDISRLSFKSKMELRRQALAVRWKPDIHGRRKVEPKPETKKRIGRSPDSMDALNLSYYSSPLPANNGIEIVSTFTGPMPGQQEQPPGPINHGK